MAIFMVLYNHRATYTLANTYAELSIKSVVVQVLATICRCGVPLFFMASGVLLLKKDENFSYIFKHRIVRIFIVMIACTFIRGWGDLSLMNVLDVFFTKLNWYLYAYFDYLLMLPLLRGMAKSLKNNGRNYVVLVSIFYTISGVLIYAGLYTGLIDFAPLFNTQFASLCWGIIFPLSGYWIENTEITLSMHKYCAVGCIGSLILSTWFVMDDISRNAGVNIEQLRLHFIYLPTLFIFIITKCLYERSVLLNNCKIKKGITAVAGTTFGIFIIETHSQLINFVNWKLSESAIYQYVSDYMMGWISIVLQFTICFIIIWVLKRFL